MIKIQKKYFFQFWLESPEKIKRWFQICMNSWIFPIFEIKGSESACFKILSPLKVQYLSYFLMILLIFI